MHIKHVNDNFNIFDNFINLYTTPRTDAAALTSVIKEAFRCLNIPSHNHRISGASSMAGVHSGVQKCIRDENLKAVNVHRTNQTLNLAQEFTVFATLYLSLKNL